MPWRGLLIAYLGMAAGALLVLGFWREGPWVWIGIVPSLLAGWLAVKWKE